MSPPATIYDIARICGVSVSTVSRVLKNDGYPVSEPIRKLVLDTAVEIEYTPRIRRNRETGEGAMVYVIIPSIVNPFYSQLITGVEQALQKTDARMILFNTKGDPEAENGFVADIANNNKNCLGAIIASICPSHSHLLQLKYSGVPVVAFDQQIDIPCHQIAFNHRSGGYMAAMHLLETGRKKIGFLSSPLTRSSRHEVYTGFCSALKQHGLRPNSQHVKISDTESDSTDYSHDFGHGAKLAKQLLDQGNLPDAVFCVNDVVAVAAMQTLQAAGIRVPEQIAVVGFDNTFISQIVTPKLTTIDQSTIKMGNLAIDLLLDVSPKGGDEKIARIILEPTLVVRGST